MSLISISVPSLSVVYGEIFVRTCSIDNTGVSGVWFCYCPYFLFPDSLSVSSFIFCSPSDESPVMLISVFLQEAPVGSSEWLALLLGMSFCLVLRDLFVSSLCPSIYLASFRSTLHRKQALCGFDVMCTPIYRAPRFSRLYSFPPKRPGRSGCYCSSALVSWFRWFSWSSLVHTEIMLYILALHLGFLFNLLPFPSLWVWKLALSTTGESQVP